MMRSKIDIVKGILALLGLAIFVYLAVGAMCVSKKEIAETLIQMMQILK